MLMDNSLSFFLPYYKLQTSEKGHHTGSLVFPEDCFKIRTENSLALDEQKHYHTNGQSLCFKNVQRLL